MHQENLGIHRDPVQSQNNPAKTPVEDVRTPAEKLIALIGELRGLRSQRQFSREVGVSNTTISLWERGSVWPAKTQLQKLAAQKGWTYEQLEEYLEANVVEEQAEERSPTFQGLLANYRRKIVTSEKLELKPAPPTWLSTSSKLPLLGGEPPDLSCFYGRAVELAGLKEMLLEDRCVVVYGPAGVGKSTLIGKLVQEVSREPERFRFDYFFWKSLHYAPTLDGLVSELLRLAGEIMSHTPLGELEIPRDTDGKVSMLIEFLSSCRCLLVLDAAEVLEGLKDGERDPGGQYVEYRDFLRRIIEEPHQSCVILTSTEPNLEVTYLQEKGYSTRSLKLGGLGKEARQILRDKGLTGEDKWGDLIYKYRGNPSFLKAIASEIIELWDGNIDQYLKNESTWVGDPVRRWLSKQLGDTHPGYSSSFEKRLLYYLAEEVSDKETMTLNQVVKDFDSKKLLGPSRSELFQVLKALINRSLVEKNSNSKGETLLSLQPTVKRYVLSEAMSTN